MNFFLKHTLFTALLALFVLCSVSAHAKQNPTTFFPPSDHENCNTLTKKIYLSWDGGPTTACTDGQSIISNAFNCTQDGAQLVYEGGRYICKSPGTIPTCSDDQFLSYDGASYTCKTIAANPTCSENQVLTNTENGLICVDQSVSMPTCSANQFLTYNGTTYQCATTQQLSIPTCAIGEMLSKDANGGLACVEIPIPSGTLAGFCTEAWGGVVQVSSAVAPAYFNSAYRVPALYDADGKRARIGCSCPEGWTKQLTGTCNFGNCTSTPNGQRYYNTCRKN